MAVTWITEYNLQLIRSLGEGGGEEASSRTHSGDADPLLWSGSNVTYEVRRLFL